MTWPNIVAHVISLHLVDLAKQKTGRRLVIITDKRRCNIGRRLVIITDKRRCNIGRRLVIIKEGVI